MKVQISQKRTVVFFVFIAITVFSIGLFKPMLLLLPLLCVLVFCKKATMREIVSSLLFGGLFSLLISLNIVEFPMFPQAAEIFSMDEDVFYWFSQGHPHAIRLLIVYPGVMISKAFRLTIDLGVTIYSASLMILIVFFMMRMLNIIGKESRLTSLLSGIFVLALSIVMNGRLIFVFFGVSLLALYELKYREKETSIFALQIITGVAVSFTMVSSGTMMISMAYTLLILPYRWKKTVRFNEKVVFILTILISLIPVISLVLPYIVMMTCRNIDYYGGGIQGTINLINHGLGRYINTGSKALMLLLFVMGAMVVLINIHVFRHRVSRPDNPDLPLILLVNLSVYGSIFGLSTGMTGLIPFLVLAINKFSRSFRISMA